MYAIDVGTLDRVERHPPEARNAMLPDDGEVAGSRRVSAALRVDTS
jgi:hypothetical protein